MIVTLSTTAALQRTMTFEQLKIDAVNRAVNVKEYASGKGINAARVVHTLGQPVIATGFLGGDSGAFCRRDLDSSGIGHDFVSVDSKTRGCVTLVDRENSTATELIEEAEPVTSHEVEALLDKLPLLLRDAKVLILSGTLAPGCGDEFYARCVEQANAANVRVILDAKGPPLKNALRNKPFVIKPNRAELALTVGQAIETEQQLHEAMRAVVSLGATWVVATDGPSDTIVSDGTQFWRLKTPAVKVASPIGSGDSFAAGLAVGLMNGDDVPAASRLAVACGAANAMTDLAGHLQIADVDRLKKQIELTNQNAS